MSFAVDGKNLHRGKPVDGEPMQSREHAVAASADVAAGAHLVATAAGNGYPVPLVQVDVGLAQLLPRADAVAALRPRAAGPFSAGSDPGSRRLDC